MLTLLVGAWEASRPRDSPNSPLRKHYLVGRILAATWAGAGLPSHWRRWARPGCPTGWPLAGPVLGSCCREAQPA